MAKKPNNHSGYTLPEAKIHTKNFFRSVQPSIREYLYRHLQLELFYNPSLKLYSRIDESQVEFEQRCTKFASSGADEEANKLRKVLESKVDRINDAIKKAEDKVRETEFDALSRKQEQRNTQVLDIASGLLEDRDKLEHEINQDWLAIQD